MMDSTQHKHNSKNGTLASPKRVDELADQINAAWHEGVAAEQKSIASFLKAGHLLNQLKVEVGHGNWESTFRAKFKFKKSKAEALMRIAANPVLSKPQFVEDLPPSWGTLSDLASLPEEVLLDLIESGDIHPEMTRSDISRLPYVMVRQLPEAIHKWLRFATEHQHLPTAAKDEDEGYKPYEEFLLKELTAGLLITGYTWGAYDNLHTIRYHLLPWMLDLFDDLIRLDLREDEGWQEEKARSVHGIQKYEEGIDRKADEALEMMQRLAPKCEKLLTNTDVAIRVSKLVRDAVQERRKQTASVIPIEQGAKKRGYQGT